MSPIVDTASLAPQRVSADEWVEVCSSGRLRPDRGVCALIGGVQIAIFRTSVGELFAVSNRDPFSGASVMSRGIVGSTAGRSVVTSPMYKQRFELSTGTCLDDTDVSLQVFEIRERSGSVSVRLAM